MASNKLKLNKKTWFQVILILSGLLLIFFTYFYNTKDSVTVKKTVEKEIIKTDEEGINTFEDIDYEGIDSSGNKFIINSEFANFSNDKPNIIYMQQIICRFFFKDGTTLRITSNRGIYDNISNDMEFEENVKMYYLENRLYADKANFLNSQNYLVIQKNVFGESEYGNLVADKLDFDLNEKKLKISMYNEGKVNIKVNY